MFENRLLIAHEKCIAERGFSEAAGPLRNSFARAAKLATCTWQRFDDWSGRPLKNATRQIVCDVPLGRLVAVPQHSTAKQHRGRSACQNTPCRWPGRRKIVRSPRSSVPQRICRRLRRSGAITEGAAAALIGLAHACADTRSRREKHGGRYQGKSPGTPVLRGGWLTRGQASAPGTMYRAPINAKAIALSAVTGFRDCAGFANLCEAFEQILDEVLRVLAAGRKTHQACPRVPASRAPRPESTRGSSSRDGRSAPSRRPGFRASAKYAPRRNKRDHFFHRAIQFERNHAAETAHLLAGDVVARMTRQPGEINAADQRMPVQRIRRWPRRFPACRCILSSRVFIPRMVSQQSNGEGTAPVAFCRNLIGSKTAASFASAAP